MREKFRYFIFFLCCFWFATSHAQENVQWMCSVDYWNYKGISTGPHNLDCFFTQNVGCQEVSKLSISNGYVFLGDEEPAKIRESTGGRLWAERENGNIYNFYSFNAKSGVLITETDITNRSFGKEGIHSGRTHVYQCSEIQ